MLTHTIIQKERGKFPHQCGLFTYHIYHTVAQGTEELFVTLIEVKFFTYKYWDSPLLTVESNMNLSDPVTDLIK